MLSCYSVDTKKLGNSMLHYQVDFMVDSILPGCFPWKIVSFAAGATDRIDDILHSKTFASLDNMEAATCYLSIASPSTLLD